VATNGVMMTQMTVLRRDDDLVPRREDLLVVVEADERRARGVVERVEDRLDAGIEQADAEHEHHGQQEQERDHAVATLPAEARRDQQDHPDDRGEDHEREEHVEKLLSGGHSDRHLPR
jgi:hypothetical protein